MNYDNNFLTLDGGGSKGIYTLGVLLELEEKIGKGQIGKLFPNVYGTSTGSIIATWIALGRPIKDLVDSYFELIPEIMSPWTRKGRSEALNKKLKEFFKERDFFDVDINLGIIVSDFEHSRPVVFKSFKDQAHNGKGSFEPGFGASLADAVEASCSAYPFFEKKEIETKTRGELTLVDGGFVANNPTIIAYIDAMKSLETRADSKILSIGTGGYVEKTAFKQGLQNMLMAPSAELISKTFNFNANSNEQFMSLLKSDVQLLRVNDQFPDIKTNLFEKDEKILQKLHRLGRKSFLDREKEVEQLFNLDKSKKTTQKELLRELR